MKKDYSSNLKGLQVSLKKINEKIQTKKNE
jgi:hypothetical protein